MFRCCRPGLPCAVVCSQVAIAPLTLSRIVREKAPSTRRGLDQTLSRALDKTLSRQGPFATRHAQSIRHALTISPAPAHVQLRKLAFVAYICQVWRASRLKCGAYLGLDKVGRLYQRHAVSKTCHIQAYLKKMRRTRQASRRCHGGLMCFTCLATYLCLPCDLSVPALHISGACEESVKVSSV